MKKIKYLVFILIFSLALLSNNHRVQAALWSNVVTDMAIHVNEQLMIELRISANATAKMFSVTQAQVTIQSMLNNGTSSPKYITNYQQYLIEDPKNRAYSATKSYVTEFLLKGRYDNNYTRADAEISEEGIQISFETYLKNSAFAVLKAGDLPVDTEECPELTDEKVRSNGGIFANGNMNCFSSMMNNSTVFPIVFVTKTQSYYQNYLENEMLQAQVIAQTSGGYLPVVDEKGDVTMPAGTVEELQNKSVTIPIDAIINSESGLLSTLAQSLATTTITNVVNYGLGEINRVAEDNYNRFYYNYGKQYNEAIQKSGPLLRYGLESFWR